MPVTIEVPKAALSPTLPDGTTANPAYNALVEYAMRKTFGRRADVFTFVDEDDEVPVGVLNKILNVGGEVYDFPIWVELTPTEYTTGNVPAYVPFATDAEGTPYKWQDWKDDLHEHLAIGGKHYVGGNAKTGEELKGSIVKQLIAGGYKVKTKKQIEALIAAG